MAIFGSGNLGPKKNKNVKYCPKRKYEGVLPDTLVGSPEAGRVRTKHLSADRFCQGCVAEVSVPWAFKVSVVNSGNTNLCEMEPEPAARQFAAMSNQTNAHGHNQVPSMLDQCLH